VPGWSKLLPNSNADLHTDREKFEALLAGAPTLGELCKLSWPGVPTVWKLLQGYLPMNSERQDYWAKVRQHYEAERDQYQDTYHQIHIDVPLFQLPTVQRMFERVIFVWAVRLVTLFYLVFLRRREHHSLQQHQPTSRLLHSCGKSLQSSVT